MEFKCMSAYLSACLFSTAARWGLPQLWVLEEENMGKAGICPHQGTPWEILQSWLPEEGLGLWNSWQEARDVPGSSCH